MSAPVQIQQQTFMDHLSEIFRSREASLNGRAGSPVHLMQQAALDSLREIQFPDRRHEDWKYTPVTKLISTLYDLPTPVETVVSRNIDGLDSYIIEIANGRLVEHASQQALFATGVQLHALRDAYQRDDFQSHFNRYIAGDTQHPNKAFDYLNFAFTTEGFI